MDLLVTLLPARQTNYIHILQDGQTVSVVDPSDADPVEAFLAERDLPLHYILNTHHHHDHIGGNEALQKKFRCQIIAPEKERNRIPNINVPVEDGDCLKIGSQEIYVLETPGHTRGHVVYYFPQSSMVFVGDTLFSLGCGRLFEGTPAQMWQSLQKIRNLPPDTKIYCGHEYTEENACFALTIEPDNKALQLYTKEIQQKRKAAQPTLPSTIEREKACNPFFRVDMPSLHAALKDTPAIDTEIFAEIRRRKDDF